MDLAWARTLRDQCAATGTEFFMKQTGGHPHKGEDLADIPKDLRIRDFPR
jgi:protein gp37